MSTFFDDANSGSLLNAALIYGQQGWRVFPLDAGKKTPMIGLGLSWTKMATSDPRTIQDYWTTWPSANIGLTAGSASGLLVLDIDTKGDQYGLDSLKDLGADISDAPRQETPSGGIHLLYSHQDDLRNFTRKGSRGGIDVRTSNGYIVASPSTIGDAQYRWASGTSTVPAPMTGVLKEFCIAQSRQGVEVDVTAPEQAGDSDLPTVESLKLAPHYARYLLEGDAGYWQDNASAAMFSAAGAVMRVTKSASITLGVMLNNEHAWHCASNHSQNPLKWMWRYGIGKIVTVVEEQTSVSNIFDVLPTPAPVERKEDFVDELTEDQLGEIVMTVPLFRSSAIGITRPESAESWLIQDMLGSAQTGLLFGASQTLKSFIAIDLAAHVVTGLPWYGKEVVSPGPVLLVAGEGNRAIFRRIEGWRYQASIEHNKTIEPFDLRNLYVSSHAVNLNYETTLKPIASLVLEMQRPPSMVIIDTFSKNALVSENDSSLVSSVLSVCDRMRDAWGCVVLVVHHCGVTTDGRPRGSSAFHGNVDFMLQTKAVPDAKHVSQLTFLKTKDSEEPDGIVFSARVVSLPRWVDSRGVPATTLALTKSAAKTPVAEESLPLDGGLDPVVLNIVREAVSCLHKALPNKANKALGVELSEVHIEVNSLFRSGIVLGEKHMDEPTLTLYLDVLIQRKSVSQPSPGFFTPN